VSGHLHSLATWPLYLWGKNPWYLLNRRWVHTRAGLDVLEKRRKPLMQGIETQILQPNVILY